MDRKGGRWKGGRRRGGGQDEGHSASDVVPSTSTAPALNASESRVLPRCSAAAARESPVLAPLILLLLPPPPLLLESFLRGPRADTRHAAMAPGPPSAPPPPLVRPHTRHEGPTSLWLLHPPPPKPCALRCTHSTALSPNHQPAATPAAPRRLPRPAATTWSMCNIDMGTNTHTERNLQR